MQKELISAVIVLMSLCPLNAKTADGFFMNLFNKSREAKLERLMKKARTEQAWPGAVLIAGRVDSVYFHINEGFETYEEQKAVQKNAIYDMASVTKVIATTTALMQLWDDGKVALDEKVQTFIPEFTGPDSISDARKKDISILQLMTHTAGLQPFRHFWKYPDTSRLDSVYQSPIVNEPGSNYEYSDIGMIIMGKLIERLSGQSLGEYCKNNIFLPLDMRDSQFNPGVEQLPRITPTEYSPEEGNFIWGHVHDENAYSLGGDAGHAGLFSTASDLAKYARMILRGGIDDNGERFLSENVIDLFAARANIIENNSRCIGWDSPSGNASGGVYISSNSIGHTGFTGTSLWIDRENEIYVILLSNAVHPNRSFKSPNYFDWRQKIHSSVYEAMGFKTQNPKLNWRERWD